MNFNNNKNKFLSLACKCRNHVSFLGKFDTNGVPIFSFKKLGFMNRICTGMLVY